jgi:hypothetical protein
VQLSLPDISPTRGADFDYPHCLFVVPKQRSCMPTHDVSREEYPGFSWRGFTNSGPHCEAQYHYGISTIAGRRMQTGRSGLPAGSDK